jgi:hypothetical protein
MVTFDSPVGRCERCGEMVLLDQTQRECATEHNCKKSPCPLQTEFAGREFKEHAGHPPRR